MRHCEYYHSNSQYYRKSINLSTRITGQKKQYIPLKKYLCIEILYDF